MRSLANVDHITRTRVLESTGVLPIRTPAKETFRSLLARQANAIGLTSPAIDLLVAHSQITDWRPGQEIISPTDRCDLTHFLVSGAVRLDVTAGRGRTVTVTVLPPGRFIGTILPLQAALGFTATAHVPSLVAVMSHSTIREVCQRLPHDRMMRLAAHQTHALDGLVRNRCLVLASALRERVLHTLTDLARDFGRPVGDRTVIDLPLRHEDLSKMVVASRANVTRALITLRGSGLVDLVERRLAIRRDPGPVAIA